MSARKINFYLNTSDRLRSLTHEARRNAELHQVLVNIAPLELTQACRVKQLRDGTLTLLAENAAIAAKLKQLAARLLVAYQKLRCEVTSIRFEVQVREAIAAPVTSREVKRLSIETIENLERLAEGLDDSPLKQALTTMATRQRKGA
ncbi:MAG: DciA family protein [Betaproteobacteria bacterium]